MCACTQGCAQDLAALETPQVPYVSRRTRRNRERRYKWKKSKQEKRVKEWSNECRSKPWLFPQAQYVNYKKSPKNRLSVLGDGVYVTKSNAYGYTLRAGRVFQEGDWITQYGGVLLSSNEMRTREEWKNTHVKGGLGGGQGLDGFKVPDRGLPGGSFVNHNSINPNAKLVTESNGVFVRAVSDIKLSSIITIDYFHSKGHASLEQK
jgi:hypothetical protein